MKDPKRVWVWVGVIIVVLAIALAFVWKPGSNHPVASGPTPVFAPQGQLVAQFPKNLIVDTAPAISGSYSIAYASSTNQYTAEYSSSSSIVTLYNQYKTYFGQNGWTITNNSTATAASKIAAIYAATSTANVNVTMVAKGKGTNVTISYVGQ